MDKEKEIEEMIEVLSNKHFERTPHEYIADMPRAICSALVEAGYRHEDDVRRETLKVAYRNLYGMCKHRLFKNGKCGAKDILIWAREEGIDLN